MQAELLLLGPLTRPCFPLPVAWEAGGKADLLSLPLLATATALRVSAAAAGRSMINVSGIPHSTTAPLISTCNTKARGRDGTVNVVSGCNLWLQTGLWKESGTCHVVGTLAQKFTVDFVFMCSSKGIG